MKELQEKIERLRRSFTYENSFTDTKDANAVFCSAMVLFEEILEILEHAFAGGEIESLYKEGE